jgi:FAD/FMN-containing dehydrogenase
LLSHSVLRVTSSLNAALALDRLGTPVENLSGKAISKETTETLKRKVNGQIVLPSDPSYDEVREIWNAMIDRRPAVIVRCAEASDVVHAISFARENGLEISIRGEGHNIAGNALCEGGVMIDLSTMRRVRVNAEKKRAYVEPGATLADFDKVAQSHGLATPVGINSTTGIAGLTLGGGFGWLTRKYGMTVDNLVSADVVTADGRRIRASENENADLFWAIRGGGGNFGIVTQFEFKLHEVGPEILAGLIVFPFEQAKQVLTQYREFVKSAPEELNVWALLRKAPRLTRVNSQQARLSVLPYPVDARHNRIGKHRHYRLPSVCEGFCEDGDIVTAAADQIVHAVASHFSRHYRHTGQQGDRDYQFQACPSCDLRSFLVFFFFRSSTSYLAGVISPLVIHDLSPFRRQAKLRIRDCPLTLRLVKSAARPP